MRTRSAIVSKLNLRLSKVFTSRGRPTIDPQGPREGRRRHSQGSDHPRRRNRDGAKDQGGTFSLIDSVVRRRAAPFESGIKVALKITPLLGRYPPRLGPPSVGGPFLLPIIISTGSSSSASLICDTFIANVRNQRSRFGPGKTFAFVGAALGRPLAARWTAARGSAGGHKARP